VPFPLAPPYATNGNGEVSLFLFTSDYTLGVIHICLALRFTFFVRCLLKVRSAASPARWHRPRFGVGSLVSGASNGVLVATRA
jgi:hypothetical protein